MDERDLPAFSWPIHREQQPSIRPLPWHEMTPERIWGTPGDAGAGAHVRVCIIDSGVEGDHPAIGGMLQGSVAVERGEDGPVVQAVDAVDVFGHGTACAGIIHALAPAATLYSVRVLGPALKGGGSVFLAGLEWAVAQRMEVINLSLSTRKQELVTALHDLADRAYFQGTVLVAAANNVPIHTYPWLFASVISVASHAEKDPYTIYYNPHPPVEFTAPGVDLDVAWRGGGTMVGTGNSYATPHIAGLVACILGRNPGLTPFQVKTALYYSARNVRQALHDEHTSSKARDR